MTTVGPPSFLPFFLRCCSHLRRDRQRRSRPLRQHLRHQKRAGPALSRGSDRCVLALAPEAATEGARKRASQAQLVRSRGPSKHHRFCRSTSRGGVTCRHHRPLPARWLGAPPRPQRRVRDDGDTYNATARGAPARPGTVARLYERRLHDSHGQAPGGQLFSHRHTHHGPTLRVLTILNLQGSPGACSELSAVPCLQYQEHGTGMLGMPDQGRMPRTHITVGVVRLSDPLTVLSWSPRLFATAGPLGTL